MNTVTNCVFASNQTNGGGGGAYFEEGNMTTVTNCTFYDNESVGRGGGIAATNFPFNLRNSIFIDNRAHEGPEIYLFNLVGDVADIDHNLIEGGSTAVVLDSSPSATISIQNTIDGGDASVVFASTDADDDNYLRLKEFSPAVGVGNNGYLNNGTADPDDDIKNDAAEAMRIQAVTVDLGAYESAFATPTAQTITFTSPAKGPAGSTITLTATATSMGAVTYAVTEVQDADGNVVTGVAADAVATLGGTTLTLVAVGTVTVTALQTGGDISGTIYAASTQTQVITVSPAPTIPPGNNCWRCGK